MQFSNFALNDGSSIIPIAYGTGTALYQRECVNEVSQALKTGFRHLDTAQVYKNEEHVGTAIESCSASIPRSELYVTTKYGGGRGIRTEFEESLKKLKLSYIDLYLIHTPSFIHGKEEESWKEMEKLKEEGLVKSIGVSNYKVADLEALFKFAKVKPSVNQVRLYPGNWSEMKQLAEFCAEHKIVLESYSSLNDIRRNIGGPVDTVVQKIAARVGMTPVQVVFSWLIAKGVVIVTTSSKVDRLQEYLATPSAGKLSDEDIAAIDSAASG